VGNLPDVAKAMRREGWIIELVIPASTLLHADEVIE